MTTYATEQADNSFERAIALLPFLYLIGRIMLFLALIPDDIYGFGDLRDYYAMGSIPGLPFFDYWIEYPPVFAFLNHFLFRISSGYEFMHALLMYFLLSAAGCACLYLFIRICKLIYSPADTLLRSLVYFGLLSTVSFSWWYFDLIPAAMMLAVVFFAMTGKAVSAGTSLALGILTKWFPVLLLPAIFKMRPRRQALTITLLGLGAAAAVFVVLWIASPVFTRASLLSQTRRSSWQTVWAVLDNNYNTGFYLGDGDRLDPELALMPTANPAVISPWITLAILGAAGLVIFLKSRYKNQNDLISFAGVTWAIFLLWSSGWSPQWVLYILPLMLLGLDFKPAVYLSIAFLILTLIEWPTLLAHGMARFTPGIVVFRSLLLMIMGLLFGKKLFAYNGLEPEAALADVD